MSSSTHDAANHLFQAWRDAQAIDSDLRDLADAEIGRAIQAELSDLFRKAGRKPVGWKIGLTSEPALDLFKASEPMVGVIYEDTMLADGASLDPADTVSPRIEGEMLLELGTPPAFGTDDHALVASIANVSAAFEIADSRITGWPRVIGGATADNACCGRVLRAPQSIAETQADFTGTPMRLTRDGVVISEGNAGVCLGSVLTVYRWFIEDSHRRGRQLQAGDIILTGAMGPMIPMEPGGHYALDCPGLGSASLTFGEAS
jgi:2-keto-4-pentenoate hydratase